MLIIVTASEFKAALMHIAYFKSHSVHRLKNADVAEIAGKTFLRKQAT